MQFPARLTPQLLLERYGEGKFPMAESRDSPLIYWLSPPARGVIPLDRLHISRSLRKAVLRGDYEARINSAFRETVAQCALRDETWINAEIAAAYADLHYSGHAHSVEIWRGGAMIGGLYGVTLGGAFFGESMFSHARDASKIALTHLVARLRAGGFDLLDTQFLTDHLARLGAVEIARKRYLNLLARACALDADFLRLPLDASPEEILALASG